MVFQALVCFFFADILPRSSTIKRKGINNPIEKGMRILRLSMNWLSVGFIPIRGVVFDKEQKNK
jgi:hypothetical protein